VYPMSFFRRSFGGTMCIAISSKTVLVVIDRPAGIVKTRVHCVEAPISNRFDILRHQCQTLRCMNMWIDYLTFMHIPDLTFDNTSYMYFLLKQAQFAAG
jgi:hypothetical protein